MKRLAVMCWLLGCGGAFASLRVTALHPLMADLARQVGGERVEVFDVVGEGGNPHRFEPRPDDLKKMQESVVVLAAGKGMESYLDRVRAALGGVPVVEVGATVPSLEVDGEVAHEGCKDHDHHHGPVDPHWWHGVENMRRAARVVAGALAEADPSGKDRYFSAASAYGRRLGELKSWVKTELAKVPVGRRQLVTAHHAFGYFAREFGFEVVAVSGLNQEQDTAPQERARTIQAVKDAGVAAVFPEIGVADKELVAVAGAAGTKVAEPLIADGNGHGEDAGFEGMIRHNVGVIVRALAAPEK